ncbi:MAG: ABC transporter permease, partial [Bacteroidota bacterium]
MDKNSIEPTPPKWADRLFEWYCNPAMREEIQGDLYESFVDMAEQDSLQRANRWYWLQVFSFINRRTLSRDPYYFTRQNSVDMFRSYFKIGFRNILKNKGTTFVNAFGLSVAIGCCLVVFQFVDFIYSIDDFHSKRDETYLVQRIMEQNGEQVTWNDVPQPLGDALHNDFPQITSSVRINYQRGIVKHEDQVFAQRISFVDNGYFDLFDFPIKWGNKANFTDPEGIVLGIRTAEKYFGSNNPIGEELSIRFNVEGTEVLEQFIVKGVLEKEPPNAGFSDDMIVPYTRQKALMTKMEDWTTTTTATFVQVKNQVDLATIKAQET